VTKISQLSSIGDSLAIGDQFLIRDIDDAGSPNKSVTVSGITRALADGNATAPALAFAADKNTGIYRAGTDSLAVATNGTGRLFVDANGFVGIGAVNTGSTGAQLSTTTTSSTARLIVESTNAAGYTGLRVANGTGHWEMQVDGANQGLRWLDDGSERLRLTSAGLVGIGTSAPSNLLHIASAPSTSTNLVAAAFARSTGANVGIGDYIRLGQGSFYGSEYTSADWGSSIIGAGHVTFYTGASSTPDSKTAKVRIDSSGRVGIGSTTFAATSKLQVFSDAGGRSVFRHASGDGGVTIAGSQASSGSSLIFGNTWDTEDGANFVEEYRLFLDGPTDSLAFKYNNNVAEAMRLDSSGRLLVGASSGTHNLDMGQQLLPVSTTETKSIYRFGNASGLKRKFNLTTVAADRALFSIACGAAGVSNKVALEITVFLTGEKSGVSSDRVFTGKWSVVRGDAGTFTIANVYSAGSAGAATVTASGDNVNINAIFSVVSGGGCFVEIKGLLGTANQGSAENGFTVTMPAI
jgi:hypothetical protein